jgi:hypothetical protein
MVRGFLQQREVDDQRFAVMSSEASGFHRHRKDGGVREEGRCEIPLHAEWRTPTIEKERSVCFRAFAFSQRDYFQH